MFANRLLSEFSVETSLRMTAKVRTGSQKASAPDWERIEAQFRLGTMSTREIASHHDISETAIRKRAKRDGWERDLGEKVRAKADTLVRNETVRSESGGSQVRTETPTEAETIDVEAQVLARIRLAHRKDIGRSRGLVMKLLDELEIECDNGPQLAELGEIMFAPNDSGVDRKNDLYNKIISLPGRVKSMKDLADSLRVLVALEREAFSLDNEKEPPPPASEAMAQFLSRLHGSGAGRLSVVARKPGAPKAEALA